jgi:GTP-binding protein HflX
LTDSNFIYPNEDRAILVGIETPREGTIIDEKTVGERSLNELEELAHTAGVTVVGKMLQRRSTKDSAYYIGKGKIEELRELGHNMDANIAIFDDELSGALFRNIEDATGLKIIDRTTLILDIFAQRAQSREGKLQVELAQPITISTNSNKVQASF